MSKIGYSYTIFDLTPSISLQFINIVVDSLIPFSKSKGFDGLGKVKNSISSFYVSITDPTSIFYITKFATPTRMQ